MIWAVIINDQIVTPVRVAEGVELTLVVYLNSLWSVLIDWLEDVSLTHRKKIEFMHGTAPSHSAKATTEFLNQCGSRMIN